MNFSLFFQRRSAGIEELLQQNAADASWFALVHGYWLHDLSWHGLKTFHCYQKTSRNFGSRVETPFSQIIFLGDLNFEPHMVWWEAKQSQMHGGFWFKSSSRIFQFHRRSPNFRDRRWRYITNCAKEKKKKQKKKNKLTRNNLKKNYFVIYDRELSRLMKVCEKMWK